MVKIEILRNLGYLFLVLMGLGGLAADLFVIIPNMGQYIPIAVGFVGVCFVFELVLLALAAAQLIDLIDKKKKRKK